MKCPHCHEETELVEQDADFSEFTLVEAVATIEIAKQDLCDQCFKPIHVQKFKMFAVLAEDVEHHQGVGHRLVLHPKSLLPVGEGYEVGYNLNCSCGVTRARSGTAVPVRDEEKDAGTPWE